MAINQLPLPLPPFSFSIFYFYIGFSLCSTCMLPRPRPRPRQSRCCPAGIYINGAWLAAEDESAQGSTCSLESLRRQQMPLMLNSCPWSPQAASLCQPLAAFMMTSHRPSSNASILMFFSFFTRIFRWLLTNCLTTGNWRRTTDEQKGLQMILRPSVRPSVRSFVQFFSLFVFLNGHVSCAFLLVSLPLYTLY